MEDETSSNNAQKEAAFYSAVVGAWIETKMEKDRTILTLSAGGIGLLVTLVTTVGPSSIVEVFLFGAAGASFLVALIVGIRIFDRNATYLQRLATQKEMGNDAVLENLDSSLHISFVLGVILSVAVAVSAGAAHLSRKGAQTMSEKITRTVNPCPDDGGYQRSLNGLGALHPAATPGAATTQQSNQQSSGSQGSSSSSESSGSGNSGGGSEGK